MSQSNKVAVQSVKPVQQSGRIDVLDMVRALAIITVIVYHYFMEWYNQYFHITAWLLPTGVQPNLAGLEIFKGGGWGSFLKNAFVFLFNYGYTAVNLFLVLSGFVLTVGLLRKSLYPKGKDWLNFISKRLIRILIPFYLCLLVGIGMVTLRNFLFPALAWGPAFGWIDVIKVLLFPYMFFDFTVVNVFNGDLWYVSLILQLYLVFPILYLLLRKVGAGWFLVIVALITIVFRTMAWVFFGGAPMGVIAGTTGYRLFSYFLPRLFEFGFGMAFAVWYVKKETILVKFTVLKAGLAGAVVVLTGLALNTYNWGWSISDMVISVGLFTMFISGGYQLSRIGIFRKFLKFVADSSYELFMLHHYLINYLILPILITWGLMNETAMWVTLPIYLFAAVLLGEFGRRLTEITMTWRKKV